MAVAFDIGTKNFAFIIMNAQCEILNDQLFEFNDITQLDLYKFDMCAICIIERQMRVNLKAVRIEEAVKTYFKLRYPQIEIVTQPPIMKGYAVGLKYHQRKQWSINEASIKYAGVIEKYKKKDDIADCIMMLLAHNRLQEK